MMNNMNIDILKGRFTFYVVYSW